MLPGCDFLRCFAGVNMRTLIVLLFTLSLFPGHSRADAAAIEAARGVMDDFIRTFNARDEAAWADTLLFPHVRVASGGVTVTPTKAEFVATTDLDQFAQENNWSHSQWDDISVIQAGPDKVHFKVTFSRFNPQGERYATFDSLYVLQKTEQGWGIRLRSSFAP